MELQDNQQRREKGMCITPDEVRRTVHDEIFGPEEDGKSQFDKKVEAKLNDLFWRLIRWMGIPLIGMVVAWANIQMQVNQNTDDLVEGGRYTQEEQDVYSKEVDRRFGELNEDIDEIKSDVKDIRDAVVR